ncbi:MAG: 4-alpha-glucanotransferase [Clostridia bacterium]|nr:4-alpha-glucanotransferase [Clostridia bacterium]
MKRASGILMHISSLWGDYSEGSFGLPAREWIDFLAQSGFTYWQVLPFCLPDSFNSPYSSYSAFSLNPFFIDLPDLYARGLVTDAELEAARQKTPYSCEFDRLHKERLGLLSHAAERFDRRYGTLCAEREEMNNFFRDHPHTAEFCRFMALKKANGGKPWQEWDSDIPDEAEERLWRFSQYIFFVQWRKIKKYANEHGVKIIGDVPIYVSADSADVWAAPDQFCLDENGDPSSVAGVPPDYFCADGQRWGNPLYNWKRMRSDGYLWWRERAGFMTELFDGMRIDHFRGFESYFSIPAGEKTARNGKWLPGPGMELVDAIRDACGIGKSADGEDFLIIAEDLGEITDEVRRLVYESGFPGMRVLQFGFLGDADSPHLPHNYDSCCVAYTGTHDNNTLLGYVWEQDDGTRRRIMDYCGYSGSDWNACYDAVLRTMFASHAGLLILPVQDLLLYGSDTRLNTPGRSTGNWSYRLTRDQLRDLDPSSLRRRNELYGRI